MDLHIVPGVIASHVAEAHQEDLKIQNQYGCRVMTYWVDEDRGSAFCLMEAPNKEAVMEMHDNAHGLIPHEIIEVNSGIVEAFLGRIKYPETYEVSEDTGLKIFNDPAFRIILVINTRDPKLLRYEMGETKSQELLYKFARLVKQQIVANQGRLVELEGEGFVVSFISGSQALKCAYTIQEEIQKLSGVLELRMAINAGLPVDKSDRLFGTTIEFAQDMCNIADSNQIAISSIVNELSKSDYHETDTSGNLRSFSVGEEKFMDSLMQVLKENWRDSEFTVEVFCKKLGLSKSQLYRKCKAITKLSPNSLIREYRLSQSLLLLRTDRNIAETVFEVGFTSPSYYTKCFQKRFGLLPLQYLKI